MEVLYREITSRSNPLITEALKLKQKKYRDETGLFCFEGLKLLGEAADAGIAIKRVFTTEKNENFVKSLKGGFEIIRVTDSVYEKLTDENSPSGVFCIAGHLDRINILRTINKEDNITFPFILISVRDPGNLGTIIRTANAFSVGTLIISSDCADIYNPKTIRAAMGALFRMRIIIYGGDSIERLPAELSGIGFDVYSSALHTSAVSVTSVNDRQNICYAVGNEGHGLSESFIRACRGTVIIPMTENTESLNVSSAAGILMWEQYRKKLT